MIFSGNLDPKHTWKEEEVRECRFVFIGRNLNKEELEKGVLTCKVEPLRFDIGQNVEVHVEDGKWLKGKVIQHWDEGYPYTVELETSNKVRACLAWTWAPTDTDQFVRKRE